MKKKLAVMLTMALAVSMLGGCGKEGKDNTTTESSTTESSVAGSTEGSTVADADVKPLKDWNMQEYVTLGEYKGLAVTISPKEEVTEETINSLALSVYNGAMPADAEGIKDRKVALGDTVNIDYEGKKDGVAFEGGTAQGQQLGIGSGSFIEGFEEGLVDVMPGETVDLNLSFPEEYKNNPDLAGKAVVFTVTVNYIYPSDASEMKDETVAAMGLEEYKNVQELKEYCKEYLEYMAETNYSAMRDNVIVEQLMKVATFGEIPAELVTKYETSIMQTLEVRAMQAGATADDYANYYYGSDAKTYAATYATESAKQSIAFFAIAELEKLQISDEELETSLADYAEEVGAPSVEEMMGSLDKEEFREFFTFEKVADFLFENAVVTESAPQGTDTGTSQP